jgi:hypothetical protein
MDKHRENEKAFDRKIQNETQINKKYISLGTTKAKTKLPLDFIGLPGISGYYMYEVRGLKSTFKRLTFSTSLHLPVYP